MGWKCSIIIISDVSGELEYNEVLESIGLISTQEENSQPFDYAMYPGKGTVFMGRYNNNLVICEEEIALNCLKPPLTECEKGLVEQFPDSEICALSLVSTVNHWGYSIIKNKRKIRVRNGDADSGTIRDFGEPVEQELSLLNQSKIRSDGKRVYVLNGFSDEEMTEDQVGEEFVFEISSRYFGERIDCSNALFETPMRAFRVKKKALPKTGRSKSWWKFWSI